jgi:hypothetical protein
MHVSFRIIHRKKFFPTGAWGEKTHLRARFRIPGFSLTPLLFHAGSSTKKILFRVSQTPKAQSTIFTNPKFFYEKIQTAQTVFSLLNLNPNLVFFHSQRRHVAAATAGKAE